MERVYKMPVAAVYPHYVTKVEKKGRTKAELDQVIRWLTGYTPAALQNHLDKENELRGLLRQSQAAPERVAHHRLGVRGQGAGDRRPAHAKGAVSRQARRRTGQGPSDGEDSPELIPQPCVFTTQSGYTMRMLLMTSLVVGVIGALARFELAPEVAGFKMHALGVALMLFAVLGLVASLKSSTARWTQRSASPVPA